MYFSTMTSHELLTSNYPFVTSSHILPKKIILSNGQSKSYLHFTSLFIRHTKYKKIINIS